MSDKEDNSYAIRYMEAYLPYVSNKRMRGVSHRVPEVNEGVSELDTSGYIPFERRMEELFTSGQSLVEARSEQYDFNVTFDNEGNPVLTPEQEAFVDPTRTPGYDMADAFQDHHAAVENINEKGDRAIEQSYIEAMEKEQILRSVEKSKPKETKTKEEGK